MVFKKFSLSVLSLLGCLSLFATDELIMNNGEILRGEYIKTEDDQIQFKSSTFGVVSVPEGSATLKLDAPATMVPSDEQTTAKDEEATKQAEAVKAAQKVEEKTTGWIRDLLHLPDNVNGSIAGGWSEISGTTDAENVVTQFSLGMKGEETEWNVFAKYSYGKTNGTQTINNQKHGGWYKWYFWGDDRWFLHLQSTWARDRVQRLQSEIDGSVGIGYYFLKLDKYQWQLSVGGNYEDKDYFNLQTSGFTFTIPDIESWKIGIFEQFTAQPLPYINISHTFIYAFEPSDTNNYDYLLNFTVSTPITPNTSVGLAYDRSFNSAIPALFLANGITKDNTTVSAQLQYKF